MILLPTSLATKGHYIRPQCPDILKRQVQATTYIFSLSSRASYILLLVEIFESTNDRNNQGTRLNGGKFYFTLLLS